MIPSLLPLKYPRRRRGIAGQAKPELSSPHQFHLLQADIQIRISAWTVFLLLQSEAAIRNSALFIGDNHLSGRLKSLFWQRSSLHLLR